MYRGLTLQERLEEAVVATTDPKEITRLDIRMINRRDVGVTIAYVTLVDDCPLIRVMDFSTALHTGWFTVEQLITRMKRYGFEECTKERCK